MSNTPDNTPEQPVGQPVAQPSLSDLPTFDLPKEEETSVVESAEAPKETPKEEKEDKAEKAPVYKNLKRAAAFKIEGIERPLYGRGFFSLNPYAPREASKDRIPLAMPSLGMVGIASNTELINSLDYRRDTEATQWLENLDQGTSNSIPADGLIQAMNREGSNWEQIPRYNDRPLVGAAASTPAFENKELKESQALMYALSGLGLGTPFQAPMWHSGFWVNFRPASEEAWINFNERLTSDKILIGRNSSGLAFSNVNAIFTERALEFALDHMIGHSIQLESTSQRRDIFKHLRAQDIPVFLWGFLVANFPAGYPINRACTGALGSCTAEISEMLNLRIIHVTDTNCLEDRHRAHMAKNYPNAVTEKEVREYQSSLLITQGREYTLFESDKMKVQASFEIPNAEEYMLSGRRWFDGIVEMVNKVLTKEATDRQREQTYQTHAKASVLREYSHWVKELKLDSNVVKHGTTKENLLMELTPQSALRETFYEKIRDYIDQTTMSLIALPNYHCPVCEQSQKTHRENDKFTDALPLDVSQAFFSLALLRTMEIANR